MMWRRAFGASFILSLGLACSSTEPEGNSPGGDGDGDGDHPGSGGTDGSSGGAPSSSGGALSSSGGVEGSSGGAANGSGGGGNPSGDVVFHATFEARAVGTYSQDMVVGDFGAAPTWSNGLDEGRAAIVDEAGGKFLRVTYPANEFGPGDGGVQFKILFVETYQELYLAYRVRFGAGFQWVKGGKLPGLIGGTGPTGCVADDTGFSARMMWRAGGHAVQYLYFPEKTHACGDDYGYQSGGNDVFFQSDTWHTVEHRIVMNDPGSPNGVMQAWFDGELVLDEQTFPWRKVGFDYGINGMYFSTFFGGSDATWAPTVAQTIDYDDFVASTGRIHP